MLHKLNQIEYVEVKLKEDAPGSFAGYASVFNGVDSYGDTIIPGAFAKTLEKRSRPIQMRWNHFGDVIGKWTNIQEDEKGLYVEGELTPNHSKANDVYALLKHGAISGLSIGYRPIKAEPNGTGGDNLHQIDLVEISVVESPADTQAQIEMVKNTINQAESLKEIESLLRDAGGFSRADATALVSRIKHLSHGEREEEEKASEIIAAINAATLRLKKE